MSSDNEVEVVVPWDVPLKQSPIYVSAKEIFSGKAHKAPSIDKKRTVLLSAHYIYNVNVFPHPMPRRGDVRCPLTRPHERRYVPGGGGGRVGCWHNLSLPRDMAWMGTRHWGGGGRGGGQLAFRRQFLGAHVAMWVENDGGRMRSGRDTLHWSRSLGRITPRCGPCRAQLQDALVARRRAADSLGGRTIGSNRRRPGGCGGGGLSAMVSDMSDCAVSSGQAEVVRAHVPPGRGPPARSSGAIVPRAYVNCPRHDDRDDGGIRVREGACRVRGTMAANRDRMRSWELPKGE